MNAGKQLQKHKSQNIGKDPPETTPAKKKCTRASSEATTVKKAQAQRKALETQQIAGHNIIDAAHTDSNWKSFQGSKDLADLMRFMDEVKSQAGDFGRSFATEKMQDLKNIYDEKQLNKEMKDYTARLAKPVSDLEQAVQLLLRLKAARSSRA